MNGWTKSYPVVDVPRLDYHPSMCVDLGSSRVVPHRAGRDPTRCGHGEGIECGKKEGATHSGPVGIPPQPLVTRPRTSIYVSTDTHDAQSRGMSRTTRRSSRSVGPRDILASRGRVECRMIVAGCYARGVFGGWIHDQSVSRNVYSSNLGFLRDRTRIQPGRDGPKSVFSR